MWVLFFSEAFTDSPSDSEWSAPSLNWHSRVSLVWPQLTLTNFSSAFYIHSETHRQIIENLGSPKETLIFFLPLDFLFFFQGPNKVPPPLQTFPYYLISPRWLMSYSKCPWAHTAIIFNFLFVSFMCSCLTAHEMRMYVANMYFFETQRQKFLFLRKFFSVSMCWTPS